MSSAAPGPASRRKLWGVRAVLVVLALVVVKLLLGPYALIDDDVHHLLLDYRLGFEEYLTIYARAPHFRLRPLPFLSLWVEGEWLRLGPDVMHAISLAWVGVGALAIGGFCERLSRSAAAGTLAALLFVVHPVQCEIEGWVSARFDAMAIAFVALAMAVEARRSGGEAAGRRRDAWLAPALYACSLLCKESPLALVPVLALVPWLLGGGIRESVAAGVRHGAALVAVLVARFVLMGRLVGAEAWTDASMRWANFGSRFRDLLFPVKGETAYLPDALVLGLVAVAGVLAVVGLARVPWSRSLRALGFLVVGVACCELPVSMTPPGPALQDPRLLSLFLVCLVPVIAAAGRAPLAALLVASAAIMPGNLRAYREAYEIHRATVETLRGEVRSHDLHVFVQGLPAVRAGVKVFFGSVALLEGLCAPAAPRRLIAVPDLSARPEVVVMADEFLAGLFAEWAVRKSRIRRLVFDPAAGRPVVRDEVVLQLGQSLVPGSKLPVPPLGQR